MINYSGSFGRSATSCVKLAMIISAAACAVPMTSFAAPTARISASRTSGPAPLAVFFDATGTTDSNSGLDTFRELGYRFMFDDAGAGNWTHSGRSRNEQIGGPTVAHVFERPGTYTVQVTAKDAAGASSVASVTITVQDPATVFSGSNTVCLSRNSDFTGCPTGAERLANVGSWPAFESNHRYLLHRGQDFTALGGVSFGSRGNGINDAQLGAYGTGAKPLIGALTIPSGIVPEVQWHHRIAVMDLDASNIVQFRGGVDLLIFRNTVNRGGMIDFASAFSYSVEHSTDSGWRYPENIFIVENEVDRNYSRVDNTNGISGNAIRLAVMGNLVDRTWEHNVRIWQAHKMFVGHNNLTGRCGESIRHPFKLHAYGIESATQTLTAGGSVRPRTSQVTIADNLFGSSQSNINWLATSGPQNNESAEGIEYLIWEDNQFRNGSNYFRDLTWAGRQISERGNRNVTANRAATFGVGGADSLPSGWNGPYFTGGASMKTRFAGTTDVRPRAPTALTAN